MANKLVSEMQLPPNLAHLLAARRLTTAKDVLSLPEVELMCLLDAGLAIACACLPYQTLAHHLFMSSLACPAWGFLNN